MGGWRVSGQMVFHIPIFSYAALVPWTFFSNGLTQAATGMVSNANLITKIYFPRLALPIARVLRRAGGFWAGFSWC